ncbi:MAG: TetR family transcriptional regulator [Streptosporangiaceae bacterium]
MTTGRRRGPTETRPLILKAAAALFAEKGFAGASVRAIARSAAVDPALVHHFFGTKEALFVAAMEFPFDPVQIVPTIVEGPREEIGERMVRTFLGIWTDELVGPRMLAILRTATTSEQGAVLLREFVTATLLDRIGESLQVARLPIALAAGQMVGLVMMRYVLELEPVVSATDEELIALLAPVLQGYLGS